MKKVAFQDDEYTKKHEFSYVVRRRSGFKKFMKRFYGVNRYTKPRLNCNDVPLKYIKWNTPVTSSTLPYIRKIDSEASMCNVYSYQI